MPVKKAQVANTPPAAGALAGGKSPTVTAGSPAAKPSGGSGYSVARPGGLCAVTQQPIEPGEKFHAALREAATGLERIDVKEAAWAEFPKDGLLASWLTKMPTASEEKKKIFVDDEVLVTLFERLADTTEPVKIRFRFVLGLILMRKRLVTYESQREERSGQSIWTVKVRGKPQQPMDLINPHLNEEAVGEVSAQLGEILSSEL